MTAQTAKERLAWLLNLLPQIADEEWHTIQELERQHGPAARRLVADLRELADRGNAPGGFVEGLQIYFRGDAISVRSNHFLRPVLLTPSEAATLELGLALLEGERPPDERPAIERVRGKVRESLTTKSAANIHGSKAKTTGMHADAAAAGDPALVSMIRKAMRGRRVVEIAYQRSGSAISAARRVHPYELSAERGKWMLWAFDEQSGERRMFRVDRVRAGKQTSDRFERPADASAVPSPSTMFASDKTRSLSVKYSPRISKWIGERVFESPSGIGIEDGESITVEHPLRDAGWAVRHVLQYGPDAVVVAPPEIRDAMRATLQAILANGAAGAPTKRVRKRSR